MRHSTWFAIAANATFSARNDLAAFALSYPPSRSVSSSLGPRLLFGAFLCAFVALGPLTPSSRGGVIITFAQNGPNVFANGNGTLNITDLSFLQAFENSAIVQPDHAAVAVGPNFVPVAVYAGATGPSNFGPGGLTGATIASGNAVGIYGVNGLIDVPLGYTSGSSLSGSAEWANTTISDLGLTPGTYTSTWGSGATADFFEVVIPSAPVPEPSSLILVGTALGVVGCYIGIRRGKEGKKRGRNSFQDHSSTQRANRVSYST